MTSSEESFPTIRIPGRQQRGQGPGPRTRALVGQVGNVLADLPLFLTAPLYRR